MKYFSLFSGIGGFELGIEQALSESSTKNKATCVGYSEIDRHAIRIYEKHFNHKNYGDIKTIDAENLPDIDLLVGGFPCQPFSIAGQRKGFKDPRGTLFFDITRILKSKRPRLFLLENVKGLLSHDHGNTFKSIVSALANLGYDVQWQVLDSQNFGVPQHRERVFIVGHLRGTSKPEVFPFVPSDIENAVVPFMTDIAPVEAESLDNFIKIKEATNQGYAEARVGQSIDFAFPNSKTRRGRVSDIARTLVTEMQQYTLTNEGAG